MSNAYSETMRIFTKILKPSFSNLRGQGYFSVTFMDDFKAAHEKNALKM